MSQRCELVQGIDNPQEFIKNEGGRAVKSMAERTLHMGEFTGPDPGSPITLPFRYINLL
jgi:hypothetical protein